MEDASTFQPCEGQAHRDESTVRRQPNARGKEEVRRGSQGGITVIPHVGRIRKRMFWNHQQQPR